MRPEHEPLEREVGELLAAQPPRAAPRALESRVLAEIERRAAHPWWKGGFSHWPLPVRIVFLCASLAIVKFTLTVAMAGTEVLARPIAWVEMMGRFYKASVAVGTSVLSAIPPHWLYAGATLAVASYIALFVLGATAYRTLYLNK